VKVLGKLLQAAAVALVVSLVVFTLLHASGDLAASLAGESATAEQIQSIRVQYGLDRPLPVQYWRWLSSVLQGDLGRSMHLTASVAELIANSLPNTLKLGLLSLVVAVAIAIPLGIVSAARPNTWIDRLAGLVAVSGQAMPTFWFGLLLMFLFGMQLRLLPISGSATLAHFVLPAAALGFHAAPPLMRLTRTAMLEALGSDYIRTAHAKGLPPGTVLIHHAFRNSMMPVIALLSVQLGHLLGGSIVIESVFAIQGIGLLAWESIKRNDFPVVQGLVLVVATIYIVLVTAADLLIARIDPRLRGD
jgi:peptide/nickel transport system permease protein